MRRTLLLTIGLLAASVVAVPAASAHDYHRSHRAVENSHGRHHFRPVVRHRYRHPCPPRRQAFRAHRGPALAIIVLPRGTIQLARAYR